MSTPVRVVTPETPLEELLQLIVEAGISGVPVVDAEGRAIGMISKTDLVWHAYEEIEEREDEDFLRRRLGYVVPHPSAPLQVSDLMRTSALTVAAQTPIVEAAALMAGAGVHRLPVVDGEGRVIGIVSALDVLGWVAREGGSPIPRPLPRAR